ncbi:MAG: type II toxin-antitoxin system Phd/YefM family antitoxin [Chloroflexota bacterium]
MKIVNITEVRQDATKLIEHAKTSKQPVLVLQRSRPAAYLVDAGEYDRMQAELKRLRHEQFWQDVAEAETEYRAGKARVYGDAESLIADLDLEK